jgi:hypothetical protein
VCEYEEVPRIAPRAPIGLALALYQAWLRLPPKQRAQIMSIAAEQGRRVAVKHGPRVAAAVVRKSFSPKP